MGKIHMTYSKAPRTKTTTTKSWLLIKRKISKIQSQKWLHEIAKTLIQLLVIENIGGKWVHEHIEEKEQTETNGMI